MITAWIGAIVFLLIMVLYILLALGFPLGEFAMGGEHKVLPKKHRTASAVSVVVQAFAILVILQLGGIFSIGLPAGIAKGAGYFFAFYLFINTFMNFTSKSKKEKMVMTPLSAIVAVCFLVTTLFV